MNKNEVISHVSGFIDKDTEIIGEMKFKESFRIDGKFKGKILSGHSLIVGETGDIEADIDVGSVSINGKVKGSLKATEKIEIFSNGKVVANIISPKLVIEDGAFFQGTCQMEHKAVESKSKEIVEKSFK